MNKITSKVVLTMLTVFGLSILFCLVADRDALATVGMLGFFAAIFLFFIGLIMAIFSTDKEVANGLMLGSLLVGTIGFGICTSNFGNNSL